MKRTKIICTIGPSSEKKGVIEKMVKAGMNVARLNFSHGTYENHALLIKNIREITKRSQQPIAILQDLQGPKIRVGDLPEEGISLKPKEKIVLTTRSVKRKLDRGKLSFSTPIIPGRGKLSFSTPIIPVTYQNLHQDVKAGNKILLDDGLIELRVLKVVGHEITCEVVVGGLLTSHKGINLPDTSVSAPAITKKDKQDLKFGISQHVDWVALSFVTSAKEVYDLKYLIKQYERENQSPAKIIVKIEKHEAVKNFKEILEAADGIMIARGDLGIEIPAEEVPLVQKNIIDQCLEKAKPVIVATQMLDSMIRNPRPTRAEVSDVANAVIDHTDAVMLSGETASGKYPVEAVKMMAKITQETEASAYDDLIPRNKLKELKPVDEAMSSVANILVGTVGAKAILAASLSGYTGRIISRYRPELPILVACDNERVQRQLNLSWGVIPFILPACQSIEELVDRSLGYIKKKKYVKSGDKLIIIAGEPVGASGVVNLVEVRTVK